MALQKLVTVSNANSLAACTGFVVVSVVVVAIAVVVGVTLELIAIIALRTHCQRSSYAPDVSRVCVLTCLLQLASCKSRCAWDQWTRALIEEKYRPRPTHCQHEYPLT